MGESIFITSGKGGTGKTTMTAALSSSLARLGHRVVCVDLDIGLRNLDVVLGMTDESSLDFSDVLGGTPLKNAVCPHPDLPELHLLCAPTQLRPNQIDPKAFAAMIRELTQEYAFCLVDSPPGFDTGFQLGAMACDRAIVVSLLEVAALRDAARVTEELARFEMKSVHLLVNRVRLSLIEHGDAMNVDDAMDTTGLPLIGVVPEDVAMIIAGNHGIPIALIEKKGAARACMDVARRLEGKTVPIVPRRMKTR